MGHSMRPCHHGRDVTQMPQHHRCGCKLGLQSGICNAARHNWVEFGSREAASIMHWVSAYKVFISYTIPSSVIFVDRFSAVDWGDPFRRRNGSFPHANLDKIRSYSFQPFVLLPGLRMLFIYIMHGKELDGLKPTHLSPGTHFFKSLGTRSIGSHCTLQTDEIDLLT